ncbi:MAG: sigma-70 family RNA polymerase sigma factor [Deinococcus sp.]|nr:sigma-70 family RNA polymerase sigma factor [Deinococcus sp.]
MDEFRALDDDQLAVLYMQGVKPAFEILVERHQGAVWRTCFLYWYPKVRSQLARSWAEDDTQEVFSRVLEALNRHQYRPQGKFLAWLRVIAKRRCLDLSRQRAREARQLSLDEPQGEDRTLGEVLPDANPRPDQVQRARAMAQALAGFLRTLRPEERQIAMLRWYEDRSHVEIAQLMGQREGAIRVKIHRLRKRAAAFPAIQRLLEDV